MWSHNNVGTDMVGNFLQKSWIDDSRRQRVKYETIHTLSDDLHTLFDSHFMVPFGKG